MKYTLPIPVLEISTHFQCTGSYTASVFRSRITIVMWSAHVCWKIYNFADALGMVTALPDQPRHVTQQYTANTMVTEPSQWILQLSTLWKLLTFLSSSFFLNLGYTLLQCLSHTPDPSALLNYASLLRTVCMGKRFAHASLTSTTI